MVEFVAFHSKVQHRPFRGIDHTWNR